MSTLAEIEAAVEALPPSDQAALMDFLAARLGQSAKTASIAEDPFAKIIGAFAGPKDATGQKAEDILYGPASE